MENSLDASIGGAREAEMSRNKASIQYLKNWLDFPNYALRRMKSDDPNRGSVQKMANEYRDKVNHIDSVLDFLNHQLSQGIALDPEDIAFLGQVMNEEDIASLDEEGLALNKKLEAYEKLYDAWYGRAVARAERKLSSRPD